MSLPCCCQARSRSYLIPSLSGGSPPRPGSGHKWAPGQSVVVLGGSRVREGQSMASMPSSSRNCIHTLASWDQALSCTRMNPGSTAPAKGLTIVLRISSIYLTAVRVLLVMTWISVRPSKVPTQTITDPPQNQSCWMMLAAEGSRRCLQILSHLSRAQCEPALICEENGGQWGTLWCCEHA